MYNTKKDNWMVLGGWGVIILIVLIIIFALPKIESTYIYIGEHVPFLGRLFTWAENLVMR